MPYRPAMKLKVTGHMFVASQSPQAFAEAAKVLDQAKARISELGFEDVEVSGTVGQLRVAKEDLPPKTPKGLEGAIADKLAEDGQLRRR